MAVHHFRVLRKLALAYGHVRADLDGFQAQTFEEAEPEDRVGTQDLPYQHLLVVHLEHFDRKVFHKNHGRTSLVRSNAYNTSKNITRARSLLSRITLGCAA
jgi:hypothetical protein